ncbi:putative beta-farnesene synthase [Helianthus debilis subsp. tardiflorus]
MIKPITLLSSAKMRVELHVTRIFKNHMDNKGNFNESLCDDAERMLALYEASYMRVEGEELLDDALEFTKTHLAIIAMDPSCDSLLRIKIQQALKQPVRKGCHG